ncbi:MAG: YeeE/YedE family protein [Sphingobacteriaceae bacterium]|nr:MAG: YeeE/YedE family protein [Sphingobacteriaceae bacterium]
MKFLKYILTGILFGIVMVKSEAVSWYRIQEMFRFQSFHMYGIIGTAVVLGVLAVFLIKKFKVNDIAGDPIQLKDKDMAWKKYLFGGIIFGLGWALTGACPGPIFVNIGYGYPGMIIVAIGAILGTYFYGVIKDRLIH